MPLAQLATIAQAGSLLTATRSLWELTRMVRTKRRQSKQTQRVEELLDELEVFVERGVLTRKEWTAFCLQVEKSIADGEATPLAAQVQVLDFVAALESIDAEFADSDYESDLDEDRRRRRHQRRSSEPTIHSESFSDTRGSLNRSHSAQDPHGGVVPQSRGIPPMPVALPSQYQNRQLYGYGRPPYHTTTAAAPPPPPVHDDPRAGVAPTSFAMPRYGASASTVAPNKSNPSFAANTFRSSSSAAYHQLPRPVPHGSSLLSSNTPKVTTRFLSRPPDPSSSHHPGRYHASTLTRRFSSDSSGVDADTYSFSSGMASPASPISSSSSRSSSEMSDFQFQPSREAQQQQYHSQLRQKPLQQQQPVPQTGQHRLFYFTPPPTAPTMASVPVAPVPVATPPTVPAQPASLRTQLLARDANAKAMGTSMKNMNMVPMPRSSSRASSTAGTYLDPQGEYGKRRRR